MDHHDKTDATKRLTDLSQHSAKPLIDPEIKLPQTVDECRDLRAWAEQQPAQWPAVQINELTRHIEFMAATLPSKNLDAETGRKRVAVYARILSGYSERAIAFLALRSCQTLEWFPTPSQCLEILAEYRDPPTRRDQALLMCQKFTQSEFEAFIAKLRAGDGNQELLASVPERWKLIAVEMGILRFIENGQFAIRAPYSPVQEKKASEDAEHQTSP